MSITIALLAAATPSTEAPVKPADLPQCQRAEKRLVEDPMRKAEPKRLGELPPAEGYLAVYRRENGCMIPVKVRDRR